MSKYAFIVVKRLAHDFGSADEFERPSETHEIFSHTYTLDLADGSDPDFEEIASSFVAAERAVLPNRVEIQRVICLESAGGQLFNSDTPCRIFWPRQYPREVQSTFIRGWSTAEDF